MAKLQTHKDVAKMRRPVETYFQDAMCLIKNPTAPCFLVGRCWVQAENNMRKVRYGSGSIWLCECPASIVIGKCVRTDREVQGDSKHPVKMCLFLQAYLWVGMVQSKCRVQLRVCSKAWKWGFVQLEWAWTILLRKTSKNLSFMSKARQTSNKL